MANDRLIDRIRDRGGPGPRRQRQVGHGGGAVGGRRRAGAPITHDRGDGPARGDPGTRAPRPGGGGGGGGPGIQQILQGIENKAGAVGDLLEAVESTGQSIEDLIGLFKGDGGDPDDPMAAYHAMRASGLSHEQIIKELTDFVVRTLLEEDHETEFRDG